MYEPFVNSFIQFFFLLSHPISSRPEFLFIYLVESKLLYVENGTVFLICIDHIPSLKYHSNTNQSISFKWKDEYFRKFRRMCVSSAFLCQCYLVLKCLIHIFYDFVIVMLMIMIRFVFFVVVLRNFSWAKNQSRDEWLDTWTNERIIKM